MYNYYEAMKNDIIDAINEKLSYMDLEDTEIADIDEDELYDDFWIDDSVTGNASGSYTFNSYQAKEYVLDNIDLCKEALEEFCVPAEEIGEKFLNEEWEYLDVTIRCYLLGQVLNEVLATW